MSLFTVHHGFTGHNEEGRESCHICLRASVSDLKSRLAAAEQERDNACENACTFEAALRKSKQAVEEAREMIARDHQYSNGEFVGQLNKCVYCNWLSRHAPKAEGES